MSGFRDAEGRFATWRDVDFKHTAVRVTAKPHWGFNPKNWEEREVSVPQKPIELLAKFRPPMANADDPLFPSTTGRPDGAMLERLKAVIAILSSNQSENQPAVVGFWRPTPAE